MTPTPFLYSAPLHLSFHFVPHEFIHLFPLLPLSCTPFLSWLLSDLVFLVLSQHFTLIFFLKHCSSSCLVLQQGAG